MPVLRYLHLDVFTSEPLAGNQLAVFPGPGALPAALMQRIAREMAFSETTFIGPARGPGDIGMRIFTPGEELPMAGHPTIGSAFALAHEGVIASGRQEFVFELGAGPTPVSLEWGDAGLTFAWMTQPQPEFGGTVTDRALLAHAMGVEPSALHEALPAQRVSCGVPYLVVPMTSRESVDAVAIDRRLLARCCQEAGLEELPVFFFTIQDDRPREEVTYCRMIAPGFGIAEDPATGSANGPLGAYLLQHGALSPDDARSFVSVQGVAMGRPSRIHISIDGQPGAITRVRVGGQAVLVGRGELAI